MAIDRAAVLRDAEELIRHGKLESAIAEYLRVVEDQPRDWNTANALGDLYVRVARSDKAIEQFTRSADALRQDGFLPKAAALYKKILKINPDHEHAQLQAGDIAAAQGLLVEARGYLQAVADRRRQRGDARGAAEMVARLDTLDRDDADDAAQPLPAPIVEAVPSPIVHTPAPARAEVDLSVVLDQMLEPVKTAAPSPDLDEVFAQMREQSRRRQMLDSEEIGFKRGLALFHAGQIEESISFLETASETPRFCFDSSATLGRIFLGRGDLTRAVTWLERAVEATAVTPAPTAADRHRVLYDLADALESLGETTRPLALWRELHASVGSFRDVTARIQRLVHSGRG